MGGHHQLRGIVVENENLSGRDRPTLKRIVTINHRSTAAKVTAELNIHLKTVSTKTVWRERVCHKSNIHATAAISKPLITENNTIRWKRDLLMIGNTLYGQMSHPSQCYQHQVRFMFGHHPRKPIILHAWFKLWNMEPDLCWFGQQCLVFCWCCTYSEWSNYCQWLCGHFS